MATIVANPRYDVPMARQVTEYAALTTTGAFRTLNWASKAIAGFAEIGNTAGFGTSDSVKLLNHGSYVTGIAAKSLIFSRLIGRSGLVAQKAAEFRTERTAENALQLFSDSVAWLAAASYTLAFCGGTRFLKVGDIANLYGDTKELGDSLLEWNQMTSLHPANIQAPDGVDKATVLTEARRQQFIKLIKAVSSVASSLFAVMAIMLGTPAVSGTVSLGVSLIGASAALGEDFYGFGMANRLVLPQ